MEFEELCKGINKQVQIYGKEIGKRGVRFENSYQIEDNLILLAVVKVLKLYVDSEILQLEKRLLVQIKNKK